MNRTQIFLALAALLLVVAVLISDWRPAPFPSPHAIPTPAKDSALSLDVRLTHPHVAAQRTEAFVTVEVEGHGARAAQRAPLHLALIIDRSGSMHGPALEHAKRAALQVVSTLQPQDRLSVVHYGSDVEVLPLARMQPEARERAQRFIQAIYDDGGTNLGGGLEAAARELEVATPGETPLRRAVLFTDGRPTEGLVEDAQLLQLARSMRASGITVSALGLGDDFNEDLLSSLAEVGAGTYGYLRDAEGISRLFARELDLATGTVARQVELVLTPGPGVVLERVLGGRGRHEGTQLRIPLPDLAAAQLERVVAAVTLDGTFAQLDADAALTATLHWIEPGTGSARSNTANLRVVPAQDPSVARERRDPVAGFIAARALLAEQAQFAAHALDQGDAAGAAAHLAANRTLVQDLEEERAGVGLGSPEELTQLDQTVREQERLLDAAPEARPAAMKQLKRQAQVGLGRVGSTF